MGIFENYIFREANQTSQPPLPKMPGQPQARPEKEDLPPDPTAYDAAGNPKGQGAGAKDVDPNAQAPSGNQPSDDEVPPADGKVPPEEESGDTSPDEETPSEEGTGEKGDPNAAGEEEVPQAPGFEQDEEKLFADLKPEQMDIKIKELKSQFRNLHITIEQTIDKINKVSPTTYDSEILDVIIRKLIVLRKLVRDSVSDTFPTRTYIENKQEFQRFANIFNNISYLLDEVYKSRMKRKDEAELFANKRFKYEKEADFPMTFSQGYDLQ